MSGRLFSCMDTALSPNPLRRVSLYAANLTQSQGSPRSRLRIHNQKTITTRNPNLMADQAPNPKPEPKAKELAGEQKSSSPPPPASPPPPPPEKPLPGDCCGSGCVRCVWDVYYEELEEYNKLYSDSGPKP